MTEHPGEQFPPDVDPDVEPGFDPYPPEETPQAPDYDTEPAPQNFSYGEGSDEPEVNTEAASVDEPAEVDAEAAFAGPVDEPAEVDAEAEFAAVVAEPAEPEAEAEVDSEAAFEASLEESAEVEQAAGHVDPAEVEFGPEFARAPGQEHEHSFRAESAAAEEPAHADFVGEDPAEDVVPEDEGAHPLVEETMGRLDELRDRPVAEHAEVYADLHERLQSALVEADAEPGDRS